MKSTQICSTIFTSLNKNNLPITLFYKWDQVVHILLLIYASETK